MSTTPDPTATADDSVQPPRPPFIRRVRIRNYKSIAFCDVTLEPLTILVGRNASGKSNFLDALAFVSDTKRFNSTEAISRHGGPLAIPSRSTPHDAVSIELWCNVKVDSEEYEVEYRLTFWVGPDGVPRNFTQESRRRPMTGNTGPDRVPQGSGGAPRGIQQLWPTSEDRLAAMRVYNINPEAIRPPQRVKSGGYLDRNGNNTAVVLDATRQHDPWYVERVAQYLNALAPAVEFAGVKRYGEYATVGFRMAGESAEFDAVSMSDGTLRALAILVAAFQHSVDGTPLSLAGIEEPETALHPAAMRAVVSALDESTFWTQVVITTHSPDLLEAEEVKPANIRVVRMIDGRTVIGPLDAADVEIVARELNTLAGLERQDRLDPDIDDLERQQRLAEQTRGAGA